MQVNYFRPLADLNQGSSFFHSNSHCLSSQLPFQYPQQMEYCSDDNDQELIQEINRGMITTPKQQITISFLNYQLADENSSQRFFEINKQSQYNEYKPNDLKIGELNIINNLQASNQFFNTETQELQTFDKDLNLTNQQLSQFMNQLCQQLSVNKGSDQNTYTQGVMVNLSTESVQDLIVEANILLRTGGLFGLKTLGESLVVDTISSVLARWDIYGHTLEQDLTKFTILAMIKIRKFKFGHISVFEIVYPNINRIVNKLQKILQISSIEEMLTITKGQLGTKINDNDVIQVLASELKMSKDGLTEKVIEIYIKEREVLKKHHEPLKIESAGHKEYLWEIIARLTSSGQVKDFNNLLKIIDKMTSDDISAKKISNNYFENLQDQKLPESQCLGCTPFFYQEKNIYDPEVNNQHLKVFSSINNMRDLELQIKDSICDMLNSSGGIILFDCVRKYEKTIAIGIKMSEKQKQMNQQRFYSYLQSFYPQTNIRRCVKTSYVPIVEDPMKSQCQQYAYESYKGIDSLLKPDQYYKVRPFVADTFVFRVIISPIDSTTVYYWKQINDKFIENKYLSYKCSALREGKHEIVKMKNLSKLIKKKMKDNYIEQSITELECRLIRKPYSCFDHECRIPQTGAGFKKEARSDSGSDVDSREVYEHASMIVTGRINWQSIKSAFIEEGIECEIKVKFRLHNFESARNTAILYHNKRFEEVLRVVTNNPNKFMSPLLIYIPNYLRFLNRNNKSPISQDYFNSLKLQIQRQFPIQQIKLYTYKINQNFQYYLECESKESTLFAYFRLKDWGQKVLLKNPQGLMRLRQAERKERWKEVHM